MLIAQDGHFMSQEHIRIGEEINVRYPNLVLCFIPTEDRETEDEKLYPYGIWDTEQDYLVKRLKENEMNFHQILMWLYENDSRNFDQFAKFKAELEKEKKVREAKNAEIAAEQADLIYTVANSPLHTFKHNGNKVGVDNNVPTLKEK